MSKKISELEEAITLYNGCCFPLVQENETKKVTYNTLKTQIIEDMSDIVETKIDKKVDQKFDNNIEDVIEEKVDEKVNETIDEKVENKVDKVEGKGLSTNDFTDDYKNKVIDTYTKSEVDEELSKSSGIMTNGIIGFEGNTIPEGFEEIDGLEIYSTDEQKIGKWINGKPLYRKVLQAITPETAMDGYNLFILPNNYDLVIKLEVVIVSSNNITFLRGANQTWVRKFTNTIACNNDNSAYFNAPAYCIVEYTKTTD